MPVPVVAPPVAGGDVVRLVEPLFVVPLLVEPVEDAVLTTDHGCPVPTAPLLSEGSCAVIHQFAL